MRAALRWLARLALGALLIAGVVAAIVVVTAHTEWGREWLRRRAEAALVRAWPGGAKLGRVEGSLLGTLIVHDVELRGRDHRLLVTAGVVRGELALWPLVVDTVRVDALVVEDVHVFAHRPPPPVPPGPRGMPSPWRAELPRVVVRGAAVEIAAGGVAQTLAGLEAAGSVVADATGVSIAGWAHGRWQDRAAELTATGAVVYDGEVRVSGALVTLGGASAVATGLVIDPDHPRGAVRLWAPAGAMRALLPGLDATAARGLGDVVADLALTPTPGATTTRLTLDATSGATRLWASLDGDPAQRSARGVVSASAIDLPALTGGRLGGRGRVLAALDGGARGVRGTVIVHCENAAAGAPLLRCGTPELPVEDAIVALDGGFDRAGRDVLTALAFGRGEHGLEAVATATGHREAGAVVLDDARGSAIATGATIAGRTVRGALAVRARARGPLAPAADVAIAGCATGGGVVVDVATLAAARGAWIVHLASPLAGPRAAAPGSLMAPPGCEREPDAADGLDHAHVAASGIRYAGAQLGAATAELTRLGDGTFRVDAVAQPAVNGAVIAAGGRVAWTAARTEATLLRTQVTVPGGGQWAGAGGSIVVTERSVAATGVALHSGDATVALRGELGRRTGAIVAHAELAGLAASRIADGARGHARGTLELTRRGGAWGGDARLDVAGFAATPDAPSIDAAAHAVLAGSRVTLAASLAGAGLGDVELAFETTAPRDPFDPGAWRALDRGAITNATVTARRVALAGLAVAAGRGAVAPDAARLTGTIDGAVNLAPGALGGGLAVHAVDPVLGAVDADLVVAPRDGDLGAQVSARWSGNAEADLTARFAIPARPFEPATWRRGGRDLLREAALDLEDVPFDPARLAQLGIAALLARHGIAAPYRGRATVELAIGAAASEAALTVELNDVTGGALVEPISQHVAIKAGLTGTHVDAAWFGPPLGPTAAPGAARLALGTLAADLAVTPDRWLVDPAAALAAPIAARWTLATTQLAPILDLVGRRGLAAGTVSGTAAIRGTLGAPIVDDARLAVRDLAVLSRLGQHPTPVLAALDATARWDGARGTAELTGRGVSGGTLHATASGRPDALDRATGALTAARLDVAWLAVALPRALVPTAGIVDAELALRPDRGVTGALHLRGGELPIAASIGTVREVSADLAVDRTITGTVDGKLGRGTIHAEVRAHDGAPGSAVVKLRSVPALGAARPIITADISAGCLELTPDRARLCGDVNVANAHIKLPEHPGTPLLDPKVPGDLVFAGASDGAARGAPEPPAHPWLVANVVLASTRLDAGAIAAGVGVQATLHSRNKLAVSIGDTVGVVGDIEIDSADLDLLGRRYDLEPSELRFDGTIDPVLAIHLRHQFPELALNVAITDRASRWKLQLTSDPGGYSTDQLFGFLIGGEPGGDSTTQTREAVAGASTRLISGALGQRLSRLLPIRLDAVSCEPATTVTSASCSAGRWLSERLFLSYRRISEPLPDENANGLDLQYRLGHKSFELSGGDRAHWGGDVLWRHRW